MLCLSRLGIQLIFECLFLMLLLGSIMKAGLPNIPLLTILWTVFLLLTLAFMATFTGLWHMLNNNLPMAFLSLQSF